jgi:hypothetical protein
MWRPEDLRCGGSHEICRVTTTGCLWPGYAPIAMPVVSDHLPQQVKANPKRQKEGLHEVTH